MLYSLPNRVSSTYKKKTDEIAVRWSDREMLPEYIHDYPDKEFVLAVPAGEKFDIDTSKVYSEGCKLFTVQLEDIRDCYEYKQAGIPFYWKYPAVSFYELQGLRELGVSQVLIDGPLFFQLPIVRKNFEGRIRVIPNVAYESYIPREDGVTGKWVRPQDTLYYEQYVDMFEFSTDDISKYETLFKVYAEDEEWINNMNILIENFNCSILATAIPLDVIDSRLTCGQKCALGRCNLCRKAITFGNLVTQDFVKEKTKELKELIDF